MRRSQAPDDSLSMTSSTWPDRPAYYLSTDGRTLRLLGVGLSLYDGYDSGHVDNPL